MQKNFYTIFCGLSFLKKFLLFTRVLFPTALDVSSMSSLKSFLKYQKQPPEVPFKEMWS